MEKIRDRVVLGIITGLIGAIPGRLLNAVEYNRGLSDAKYGQMAASVFVSGKAVNTPRGRLIGSVANLIIACTTGLTTTYLLSCTGRDYAAVKGIGVGTLYWFGLHGLTPRLGLAVKGKSNRTPLLSLIDHIIFGSLSGILASNLGHDSLFPDRKATVPEDKLPLLGAGSEPQFSRP